MIMIHVSLRILSFLVLVSCIAVLPNNYAIDFGKLDFILFI